MNSLTSNIPGRQRLPILGTIMLIAPLVFALAARGQSLLESAGGSPQPPAWTPPPPADEELMAAGAARGKKSKPMMSETLPAAPSGPQPGATPGAQAGQAAPPTAQPTAQFSLFAVVPAKPKTWAKHDLVEIVINESSLQKFEQTTDLKKTQSLDARLTRFPSLKSLLENATLEEGIGSEKPGVGFSNNSQHKGEGKFNRKDQITAKITGTIVDVKPNGTLVIEARESIQSDREVSTMVISGVCRAEDITRSNTILSTQLANMTLRIEHDGDVRDTADKGFIPRVFDAIFNF